MSFTSSRRRRVARSLATALVTISITTATGASAAPADASTALRSANTGRAMPHHPDHDHDHDHDHGPTTQRALPHVSTEFAGIIPVTPGRLLDTRLGTGAPVGPLGPNTSIDLAVLGRFGVPSSGVDTVVLNVTVVEPTAPSFITVWPTGATRPDTSNMNMVADQTIANMVIAKVGTGGQVSLFNQSGSTHLLADVVGYSTSPQHLQSLLPDRILDTRTGVGVAPGRVGPGETIDVRVTGRGGVPTSGVGSVIVNVTVTEPTAPSFITVWPTGATRPDASSLNMVAGETRPNLVIARVGDGGRISLYNGLGETHLIGDVVGWMPEFGAYTPMNPTRILDTRSGTGAFGTPFFIPELGFNVLQPLFGRRVGPDETISVALDGSADVPPQATSLVLNVTAVDATEPTFITSWPFGEPMPTASSINLVPGEAAPNMIVVERGGAEFWGGVEHFNLYNAFGQVHLIADIVGYYTPWNVLDAPDDAENVVHLVIASPPDLAPSVGAGDVRRIADLAEQWLRAQGDRGIRFDTRDGRIEVSRLTFGRTRAELDATQTISEFDAWFDEIIAGGFGSDRKKYVVFVDGLQSASSGVAALGGSVAMVFSDSLGGLTPVVDNPFTPLIFLHELFHTLGAVSECAPNYAPGSHVSEPDDLMNAVLFDPDAIRLDVGRDDYWGQGNGTCNGEPYPDLSRSPFFTTNP